MQTEKTCCIKSLLEKCSNTGFFLVCIFPHSDWIRRDKISPYSVRIRENTDQKKLRMWTLFARWNVELKLFLKMIRILLNMHKFIKTYLSLNVRSVFKIRQKFYGNVLCGNFVIRTLLAYQIHYQKCFSTKWQVMEDTTKFSYLVVSWKITSKKFEENIFSMVWLVAWLRT